MILRRIVVISRQAEIQQLARKVAQEIFVADDLDETLDIIETVNPDLILFDKCLGVEELREFITTTDKKTLNVPIVIAGDDDSDILLSDSYIRAGAFDYLRGKVDYGKLEQAASQIKANAREARFRNRQEDFFAEDIAASVSMVGRSKATLNTLKTIKLVANSNCNPVLINGETGTGKEVAAKAIHILRHPEEKFVAVNCAALTANLLESELFGHVKGSFTSADREKTGLLELAGSGTIFLDEISEMPLDLQAKLLRVLQEKTFRKVGGVKDITCHAAIIVSSNRNLKLEVKENRFRADLYYRLNICPITLAPLRYHLRREDIKLLAEYFLRTSTICPDKGSRIKSITNMALEVLEKHDWPGNVRELKNVIDRAIILETTEKIGLSSIVIEMPEFDQYENTSPIINQIKDFSLAKAECELIGRALQQTGWQKTKAAALLGITRATLYAKVKQYNIEQSTPVSKKSEGQDVFEPEAESVCV
ncbi:MAG: sigma 54-interacting transcriptional regulator [Planctomycetota bacterium]|jgi:DNA-binding NtrC family response regulator